MSICVLKFAAWPNDFSHSEQVWVFAPLWVSMCLLTTAAWPNDLWHWIQLYALSLVWVTMCLFRPPDWPNDFWHSEQMWFFSPLELREWLAISLCLGVEHSALGVCQTERSETVPCHCKGYCHFYFSLFMVNFKLSNYFWHSIVFPLKGKTMREWTIMNINTKVLARARETHFIHLLGILSAFSQF